jgi:hypothetical protein
MTATQVGFPDSIEALNERVDYRLTFAPTDAPRRWCWDMLDGPDLPNARPEAKHPSPGTWTTEFDDYGPKYAHQFVLEAVIGEAIHEALEWLRVDGDLLIDPHRHDGDSSAVHRAASAAVSVLLEHYERRASSGSEAQS